jgi:hypothetical protein
MTSAASQPSSASDNWKLANWKLANWSTRQDPIAPFALSFANFA